jgi:uncharacterized OsmC-like protein
MATTTVNGVNVSALKETLNALKDKPELGTFRFRASNTWVAGTHNQACIQGFYGAGREDDSRQSPMVFEEDEPPVLLGENAGANPVEFVLIGLSGCLTTSLVAHAAARGISLQSVTSTLEGVMDVRGFLGLSDAVRNGYEEIRVHFTLEADAPEETLQELVEVAQARSPVFDIVTHAVPVRVDYERKTPTS